MNWCRWPISVVMWVRPWPLLAHPTSAGCGPSCACAWPPTSGARPRSRLAQPSPLQRVAPGSTGMAAAAAVALTLFALGPWAGSGFAQNPINQVIDFVGGHVGVEGVDEPPPTQVPVTLPGEEVSPEQAAERLGIPVTRPAYLPAGFELASSAYYSRSVTTPEQGMYQLVATVGGVDPDSLRGQPDPRIIIYQEQATSSTIAQKTAYIEQITIGGSIPATYVQGHVAGRARRHAGVGRRRRRGAGLRPERRAHVHRLPVRPGTERRTGKDRRVDARGVGSAPASGDTDRKTFEGRPFRGRAALRDDSAYR